MTSEIRTNSLTSRAGLSTVTLTDSGPMFSGITTFVDNSGFNLGTGSSIFTPASNTLTFGTNSNERARITSGGNVGIGTDNPATKTAIVGSDSGDVYLQIANSTTGSDANSGFLVGLKSDEGATLYQMENNYMRFGTNGAERLRITSAGRILIATTTEGHSNADDLTIATAAGSLGNTGITIRSSTTGDGNIFFSDATSGDGETKGVIKYAHNTDHMQFNIAGSERLRINSNGAFGLGGATYGSSGQVLTSAGSGSVPTWTTVSGTTINNNSNGRVITASGNAGEVDAQASLTFSASNNDPKLTITGSGHAQLNLTNTSGADHTGINFGDSADINAGMIQYSNSNNKMQFHTNGGEKMVIDSSGRVGINRTPALASSKLEVGGADNYPLINVEASGATAGMGIGSGALKLYYGTSEKVLITSSGVTIEGTTDGVLNLDTTDYRGSFIRFQQAGSSKVWVGCGQGLGLGSLSTLGMRSDGDIRIRTGSEEHVTITSTGYLAAKGEAGNWVYGNHPSNYTFHQFSSSKNGDWMMQLRQEHHNGLGFVLRTANSGNNEAIALYRENTTTYGFKVYQNGNVQNSNNSYGSLSDVSLKENIVDAKSQWNDIKAVKVRNFNLKSDADKVKMLGVVAQELETVSPKLVFEDKEGVKGVHYSVLYMKAIKALQEAMTRIETLEQDNIALRARVTNLEGE